MRHKLSMLGLALVLSALILNACEPAASSEEVAPVLGLAGARDAALAYLAETYGDEAPSPGLAWTEEDATPQRQVGSSAFRYTGNGWLVTVSAPVVAPELVVCDVEVMGRRGEFYWEGQVDASGQVTELLVNPVEQAGLSQSASLEILELDLASDSPTHGEYVTCLIIDDPQLLEAVLAKLDTELRVAPKLMCIPEYSLRFHLRDGAVQEFGYSCGGASFLRGEQEFWQGKDFDPPEPFDALLGAELASTLPTEVNLVEQAGLASTVRIEILETFSSEVADSPGPGIVEAHVVHRLTLTDPQVIAQIVGSLDTVLPLGPRAKMPTPYAIEFHLEDGTIHSLGYAASGENLGILRGDQGLFGSQGAKPPAEFEALIGEQLALAPTGAVPPVPDPTRARDAAVAYLAEAYAEEAPPTDLEWVEEVTTQKGLVGASSFEYRAGDWLISVDFPVVAPQATIYQIIVDSEVNGFHWQGEVDAMGEVTELQGP